jgi:hypothetical protein
MRAQVLSGGLLAGLAFTSVTASVQGAAPIHVYEKVEITLTATKTYTNPYTDMEVWVDLKGPTFSKRCPGFWDGGQTYRVRITSLAPGTWTWVSGSNPQDPGLAGKRGSFVSIAWTEAEKRENPACRGFLADVDDHPLAIDITDF